MFLSYPFIVFLTVLIFLYYVLPKRCQWFLLLVAGFAFYAAADIRYPPFLMATAFTVYGAALWIGRCSQKTAAYRKGPHKEGEAPSRQEKKAFRRKMEKKKKRILLLCLFLNIGILAFVKYTNFVIDNVNTVLEHTGRQELSYIDFIVPLGISFYTFQAVGYLFDVYWEKCEIQKNFLRFTLFVSFFPQLVQGPISRYSHLSQTLYGKHSFDGKNIRSGLERILYGCFKKLVIADRMGAGLHVLAEDPGHYTGGFVFVGMIFYAVQLYADFTGGIDITIGIAEMFGIQVEENFIRPYFSKNIAEYWRRWHISMGTWFRDYMFYPCSISRPVKKIAVFCKKHFGMGAARRVPVYTATMLVWLVTGLWHGARWYFVVWGLANGVILLISEELTPLYQRFHQRFPGLGGSVCYRSFQVFRTILLMSCLRLFDIYGSVRTTLRQFVHMFTQFGSHPVTGEELAGLGLSWADYVILGAGVLVMVLVSLGGRGGSVRETIRRQPYAVRYTVYVSLFFAVLLFGVYGQGYDVRQFIYNQF